MIHQKERADSKVYLEIEIALIGIEDVMCY
jgi:hypothetical protein